MIFVGIDWAEQHHDVCLVDREGQLLASTRIAEGLDGLGRLQALIGRQATEAGEVVVGVETDRGLLVQALVASGYALYAINPFAASRWPIWCAPIGTTTAAWPATRPGPKRSRSWRGPTSA